MAEPQTKSITSDRAWSAVTLEQRLDLISRCHADGIMAATIYCLVVFTVSYGLDKIWLLSAALIGTPFILQMFSSYTWRRGKPELILKYLSARAVARRYAYGFKFMSLDVIIIYQGKIQEIYESAMDEQQAIDNQNVSLTSNEIDLSKNCWICLLRGGVVVLTEQRGGAKLEFLVTMSHDTVIRSPHERENCPQNAVVIEGNGFSRGRTVALSSDYPGAQYVFRKNFEQIIDEMQRRKKVLESMPTIQ